jgi:hypothetical protein
MGLMTGFAILHFVKSHSIKWSVNTEPKLRFSKSIYFEVGIFYMSILLA